MMKRFIWDDEPGGNVEHVAEHGLTLDDVEAVFDVVIYSGKSRSSGLPIIIGELRDGRRIAVIFKQIDEVTIQVYSAYEV